MPPLALEYRAPSDGPGRYQLIPWIHHNTLGQATMSWVKMMLKFLLCLICTRWQKIPIHGWFTGRARAKTISEDGVKVQKHCVCVTSWYRARVCHPWQQWRNKRVVFVFILSLCSQHKSKIACRKWNNEITYGWMWRTSFGHSSSDSLMHFRHDYVTHLSHLLISEHCLKKMLGAEQANHFLNRWWLILLTYTCVNRPQWGEV